MSQVKAQVKLFHPRHIGDAIHFPSDTPTEFLYRNPTLVQKNKASRRSESHSLIHLDVSAHSTCGGPDRMTFWTLSYFIHFQTTASNTVRTHTHTHSNNPG